MSRNASNTEVLLAHPSCPVHAAKPPEGNRLPGLSPNFREMHVVRLQVRQGAEGETAKAKPLNPTRVLVTHPDRHARRIERSQQTGLDGDAIVGSLLRMLVESKFQQGLQGSPSDLPPQTPANPRPHSSIWPVLSARTPREAHGFHKVHMPSRCPVYGCLSGT